MPLLAHGVVPPISMVRVSELSQANPWGIHVPQARERTVPWTSSRDSREYAPAPPVQTGSACL
jgi:hypothetical protein